MSNHSQSAALLERTVQAEHAVNSLTALLAVSTSYDMDPQFDKAARKQSDRMLEQLAADIAKRDAERRAVYGNRYPRVYGEQPPAELVAAAAAVAAATAAKPEPGKPGKAKTKRK